MVGLSPLKIPNCQFKVFRENSLTSNRERETHARILQENSKGGRAEIRKINKNVLVPNTKPNIKPNPRVNLKIKPNPRVNPGVPIGPQYTPILPKQPEEIVPNCEIERQLIR